MSKEEGIIEETSVPLLWSTLVETGLSEPQQPLGGLVGKRWLHIDHSGVPTLVEVDKHRIVAELGIRYRDLLILDPTVPTPSPCTLLIRDRALVANLESVRMIICSNAVFVLSVPKASDARLAAFPTLDNPFVKQLCKCLRTGRSTATLHDLNRHSAAAFDFEAPYELRALEVGLATITNILDRESYNLEAAAYPTIDRLAKNVNRAVLEDVRQVKQVMGKLINRVQRLKQELEEILEDDADMADMYLARRAMLLGEQPLPESLAFTVSPSQSTQSFQDFMTRPSPGAKTHSSEADVAQLSAGRPASRANLPHPASASSLASHYTSSAHHDSQSPRQPALDTFSGAFPHPAQHSGGTGLGVRGLHSSAADLPTRTAPEHLGHHTHARGDVAGGSGGSHHGGQRRPAGAGAGAAAAPANSGAPGKQWHRSSTIVRTVRTRKKRKSKGKGAGAGDAHTAAAAALAAADGDGAAEGNLGLDKSDSAPAALETPLFDDDDDDDDSSDDEVVETIFEQPTMSVDPHDIQDAEDLLESYFIQADYVLRRLLAVSERIDDVEDLVSIEMDHRRNELVATGLMVTIVSCGFGFCAVIVGVFGMNLMPFNNTVAFFWGVIGVMCLIALAIVAGIIWWVRKRRLLFAPQL